MRLTEKEKSEIEYYLQGMHRTKEAELMKRCVQHGTISTYDHVLRVVRFSFYLNRRFHFFMIFTYMTGIRTPISDGCTDCIIRRLHCRMPWKGIH